MVMDAKDSKVEPSKEMLRLRHKLVSDIDHRLNDFSLNTVVAGFMEYNNKFIELSRKSGGIDVETLKTFVTLLAPFAPHISEELWQELGGEGSVFNTTWPSYDEEAMKEDVMSIPVQVNGKTRAVLEVDVNIDKDELISMAKAELERIGKPVANIIKEIYVPGKIVNIVGK